MSYNIYKCGKEVYGAEECGNYLDIEQNFWKNNHDFLIICDDLRYENSFKGLYCGSNRFQELIDLHEISAIETLWLPNEYKLEKIKFNFNLDLSKLRNLSKSSGRAWSLAKKRVEAHKDYELGRKLLFHSIRIIDFGLQIAKNGMIVDYTSSKPVWEEIVKQDFVSWEQYKTKWQPTLTQMKSEFRAVAPIT